jgi:hypothetical protein
VAIQKALTGATALALMVIGGGCQHPIAVGTVSGKIPGGVYMTATRMVLPSKAARNYAGFGGLSAIAGGVRYYYDPATRAYSGYEVHAQALGNRQFTLMIEHLGGPLEDLASESPGYRLVSLPRFPQPGVVREGEALDIDLVVRGNGERLFDRIRLYSRQAPK